MLNNEDIIKDVREDENWLCIPDKNKWKDYPGSRADVYDKEASNRLKSKNIDAERWPLAMLSYKNYTCFAFSEDNVVIKGKYYYSATDYYIHYVKRNDENIKIQADILTNYETIYKLIDKFPPDTNEEKNIVDAFFRIAYTIGAFCPIWKNPGGRGAWKDTVWDKLLNSGLVDSEGKISKSCLGLEDRDNKKINNRRKENLFLIIPENRNPKEVVSSLYFQDYFSSKWELKARFSG